MRMAVLASAEDLAGGGVDHEIDPPAVLGDPPDTINGTVAVVLESGVELAPRHPRAQLLDDLAERDHPPLANALTSLVLLLLAPTGAQRVRPPGCVGRRIGPREARQGRGEDAGEDGE